MPGKGFWKIGRRKQKGQNAEGVLQEAQGKQEEAGQRGQELADEAEGEKESALREAQGEQEEAGQGRGEMPGGAGRETDRKREEAGQRGQEMSDEAEKESALREAPGKLREAEGEEQKKLAEADRAVQKKSAEAEEEAQKKPTDAGEAAQKKPTYAVEAVRKKLAEAEEEAQKKPADAGETVQKKLAEAEEEARKKPTDAGEAAQRKPVDAGETVQKKLAEAEEEAQKKLAEAEKEAQRKLAEAEEKAKRKLAEAEEAAQKKLDEADQEARDTAEDLVRRYLSEDREKYKSMCHSELAETLSQSRDALEKIDQIHDEMCHKTNELQVSWMGGLSSAMEGLNKIKEDFYNHLHNWQVSLYPHELRPMAERYVELYRIINVDRLLSEEILFRAGTDSADSGMPEGRMDFTDPIPNTIAGIQKLNANLTIFLHKFEKSLHGLGMYVYYPAEGDVFDEIWHLTQREDIAGEGKRIERCIVPGVAKKAADGGEDEAIIPAIVAVGEQ